jgi:hypothetical protein
VIVRVLVDGAEHHRGAVTRPLPDLAEVAVTGAGPQSDPMTPGHNAAAQPPSLPVDGKRRPALPNWRRQQWPIVIILLAMVAAIAVILYVGFMARVL